MSTPKIHWLVQNRRDVPRHNEWLTPRESAALAGLKMVKRRSDWRLGRWTAKNLARELLGSPRQPVEHRDIEILAAESGAPYVWLDGRPAPVGISISHSHGIGLCALAAHRFDLGCDTELVESRSRRFVSDFFAREERDRVDQAKPTDRALVATLVWSAKESVLKAIHEGLRRDTRDVIVDIGPLGRHGATRGWRHFRAHFSDGSGVFAGRWMAAGDYVRTLAVRAAH